MNKYRKGVVYILEAIIVSGWLILCSWQDIKYRKISLYLIILGSGILLLVTFLQQDIPIVSRLGGASLGVILLSLNYITRGQIGIADGIIISIIGLSLGFGINISILLLGLFFCFIFSSILIILKKANRKTTIPFIPFILLGYLGVLIG